MGWHEWITAKYVEWRGPAVGRERTVKDFAEWVGVSQQLMSSWMSPKGYKPRSKETIDKLVEKFGPEVYQVLGMTTARRVRTLEKYLDLDDADQDVIDKLVGEFWDEKAQHR